MKKSRTLALILNLLFVSSSSFGQDSALDLMKKEMDNLKYNAEKDMNYLKDLNLEKRRLTDQLLEVNKKYDVAIQQQKVTKEILPIPIGFNEIAKFITKKNMGRCKLTPGDYPGEYLIQKEKIKIKFVFLPTDSVQHPQLSVAKSDDNQDVYQIEQPGYDPQAVNLKGDIHSIIRFRINPANNPGDIIHAVFKGQRVNDKLFGQSSSLKLTNMTCVLGS